MLSRGKHSLFPKPFANGAGLLIVLALSCQVRYGDGESTPPWLTPRKDSVVISSSRDPYGCLRTAGFSWSKIRKDCIRLSETAQVLAPQADSLLTLGVAYLLFSTDSGVAEIFLPGHDTSFLLPRLPADSIRGWTNDTLMLTPGRNWQLLYDSIPLYLGKEPSTR